MRNPNSPDFEPKDREAALASAKDAFRATMLESDSFFAAVTAHLDLSTQVDRASLPEFGCEPTLTHKEDGLTIGVRLSSARTDNAPGAIIRFATFDYMNIASIDKATGKGEAEPAFVDLLRIAGVEDLDAAVREIGSRWNVGYNAIIREFPDELGVDPMTHTLELTSHLDSRSYAKEG